MAGIRHEVGAHPLDHHLLGLLAERQQQALAAIAEIDRLDAGAELFGPIMRRAEGHAAGRGTGERAGHRRQHAGVAQHPDQWDGRVRRSEAAPGGRVGLTHGQGLVDHQDRVGQGLDDRREHSLLRRHPS